MEDEKAVEAFLKEHADRQWSETGQPYLLSSAGPDLTARKVDYRKILGDETLKAFVKRTEKVGGYKLVVHPNQKAKVGVVPADADFNFPDTPSRAPVTKQGSASERERVVLAFLRVLSSLPDEDLDTVAIPPRVLAKLLKSR